MGRVAERPADDRLAGLLYCPGGSAFRRQNGIGCVVLYQRAAPASDEPSETPQPGAEVFALKPEQTQREEYDFTELVTGGEGVGRESR